MHPVGKKNNDVNTCDFDFRIDGQVKDLYRHLGTIAEVEFHYTETGERVMTAEVGIYCLSISRLSDGTAVVIGFNGNAKEFECIEVALLCVIDMIDHFCM